jgi:hypothetical protein
MKIKSKLIRSILVAETFGCIQPARVNRCFSIFACAEPVRLREAERSEDMNREQLEEQLMKNMLFLVRCDGQKPNTHSGVGSKAL